MGRRPTGNVHMNSSVSTACAHGLTLIAESMSGHLKKTISRDDVIEYLVGAVRKGKVGISALYPEDVKRINEQLRR